MEFLLRVESTDDGFVAACVPVVEVAEAMFIVDEEREMFTGQGSTEGAAMVSAIAASRLPVVPSPATERRHGS